MPNKTIQTEADALISLVNEEEKISVKEAARKLDMPVSTISEWASFLEEEGLINIEYKFTTPFLVKRGLSQEQVEQFKNKAKEEKDIFDKKSESMLTYLNKLEAEVDDLKEMFAGLGENFKTKLSKVKKEFKELNKAEDKKEELNKKIIESKQKFIKKIADINKQLLGEETNYKAIYNLLYNQSQTESHILGIQEDELTLIKETDKMLNKKLKELKKKIDKKKKNKFKKGREMNSESTSNLRAVEKKYMDLRETIDNDRRIMEEFLEENKGQEKQTEELKKEVLSKIKSDTSGIGQTIEDVKEVPKKLKSLMSRKDRILKILNGISYNEKMLREKLNDLMKKEDSLNLSGGSGEAVKEIQKLENNLEEIERKRGFFETEAKKIFNLLKFK